MVLSPSKSADRQHARDSNLRKLEQIAACVCDDRLDVNVLKVRSLSSRHIQGQRCYTPHKLYESMHRRKYRVSITCGLRE